MTLWLPIAIGLCMFGKGLESHSGELEGGYNFWFYSPYDSIATDSTGARSSHPLIVFLHGASLCGKNLDRVRTYGTIDAIEKGRKIDSYVVAPQNPGGSWSPRKVMQVVDWAKENFDVDTTRIYVIGMSLGGYGTLDFVATYPDRIAAAMALCGGATVRDLSGLNRVPLWIIHGIADRAVTIRQSDRVVEAMKAADNATPRLKYDRIPGMNHGQPAKFLYLSDTYDWLLSHSLTDEDRKVNDTFDPANGILSKAYYGLTFNKSGRSYRSKKGKSARSKRRKSSAKSKK
ncbi:MAG: prolyl oligopeptidase family serine peptidase [Muribaculaceae bacterium]|nr:prolyl oligopeptidase family serine peptidase [Muribaculaceae bacterium]